MPDGVKVSPFVRMFYGTPSQFLWEDQLGTVNHIPHGEGGEQGDTLMPLLSVWGSILPSQLSCTKVSSCSLSTMTPVCHSPTRPRGGHLGHQLWNQARITLHQGKTVIWNKAGICPRGCHALEDAARRADPNAVVWRGNVLLEPQLQGLVVFQWAALSSSWSSWEHVVLLNRITSAGDLQSAWCVLLYCAATRVNFWLRSVPPELSGEFAREHDAGVWRCLCQLLHISPATVDDSAEAAATLPLAAGGLGLQASWADMLKALSSRLPSVAANFIAALEGGEATPSIQSALSCIDNLAGIGFVVPSWEAVVACSPHDEEGNPH